MSNNSIIRIQGTILIAIFVINTVTGKNLLWVHSTQEYFSAEIVVDKNMLTFYTFTIDFKINAFTLFYNMKNNTKIKNIIANCNYSLFSNLT